MLHSAKQRKYTQTATLSVTRSKKEEALLIDKYLHLVYGAIKKMGYINSISDRDDMQQVGLITLLNMIRRFPVIEDEKEFSRLTYIRIRGSILDEIRSRDWRPAEKRKNANAFHKYEQQLTQKIGRTPTKAEMLRYTEISSDEYEDGRCAINAHNFVELSDELLKGYENDNECDTSQQHENKQLLEKALEKLTQEEVLVLHLMYEKDMSFKEIGLATNNNFSRINKIQRDAHAKMARILKNKENTSA
ncbi:sigma-70 family RNA polymerase sigma factor [Psychromonas sp. Urea-02u-13]|uniref:sigma-70 family RNA polymerase sigma factor n=1 Tax=Psychromonas sp. Urea-02u-13 TaxID=2058326 RepID=UPI000C34C4B4|nr:sigma-70 family RNA polymerase sigma factor [Psychromonas sp. Urea-02u-13]PKG40844.1 hypothetical protein CXF74_00555 [Psychromonas sp. Urea-02u-13]